MTAITGPVPIKNVAAFMAMTQRLIDRDPALPGFAVCHSYSGLGKTWASIFTQNRTGALRVEVGDSWTRRSFLAAVLTELGRAPTAKRATVPDMAREAIGLMGDDPRRPLIVDEADKLVDKGFIELVRELQERSGAPVILIGEEKLPTKLLAIERMHNRVLDWFAAQPCDLDDARQLANAFAPKLTVDDDLLAAIVTQSMGRARRIVVNLSRAVEQARNKGKHRIDLGLWGDASFFTGEPPLTRSVEPYKRQRARAA